MAKKRKVKLNNNQPGILRILHFFYFGWFPRFTIHYHTDTIDFSNPLIRWVLNDMEIVLPGKLLETKEISDSTVEDFLE